MKRTQKQIFLVFLIFFLLLNPTFDIQAAEKTASLFLLPDKATYLDPDQLKMNLQINTGDELANAVLIGLKFATSSLLINKLIINATICPLEIITSIDNQNGLAHIICGHPQGFSGNNLLVAELTFEKIKSGFTPIRILEYSSIRAHDGQGTAIPISREIHNIYIVK